MSNIFSHSISPAFTKQSISEFFVNPFFMGEDIRGAITVRTDIKGTEKLNKISRPSFITKPKVNPGFTPSGTFSLTHPTITVHPMAMEFEQNARAFWGSIIEQLLATGYKEDDVERMKEPDVWNKIMLPIIAQAGQQDLIRQMFFANTSQEELTSGIPNGTVDDDFTGYTGFMTHFFQDLYAGTIPSAQHIGITSATTAVRGEKIQTYTAGTDTAVTLTINGVAYSQAYATNATVTMANWLATHKATIEARGGINGVIVTNPSAGAIKCVGKYKGQSFDFTAAVTGTGTMAASGTVAAVKAGALAAGEADSTLEGLIDAARPEMFEFPLVFMVTRSLWRNLVHTIKGKTGDLPLTMMLNGLPVPSYEGYPVLVRPDWDTWIASYQNGIQPHRALFTTQQNLIFATDGLMDSEDVESWYNPDLQMRRYRVQYKAQTAYLHTELMMLAGFGD
ncbi:MAG: hypothetical protein EOM90_16750 [Alphaproteobacteria bacterium]|nr:hypothetical protein [Alphaproteobacteria bacterium]